jgi:uncharacterized protein (DUF885 family)
MKRWKKIVLSAFLLIVLALAVFLVPTIWGKPWSIHHFYGRVFLTFALDHPQMLSTMRILEPMGLDFHNDDLDDFSPAATRRDVQRALDGLETLRRYDRDSLDDKLSYDVLEFFLASAADGEEFAFHNYPVNQQFGVQSGLPDFMINLHQIGDEKGARNYITRLSKFGEAFRQTLESLEYRESLGIVPPRFVMTHVLKEMREFIEPAPEENDLYTHFAEALEEVEGLDDAGKEELVAQVAREIEGTVYPAYRLLIDHYAALEPTASTDDGAWKLPDGDRSYAYDLRSYTTTDLSAEEIHQIGVHEVERLQAEMKAILEAEGYPTDDFGATMQSLNKEPRFLYPDTDEGREQILVDYQKIIDEIDTGMDSFFSLRPEATVQVERIPEFKQETSPGAYYMMPSMDGSRPGTFYVNLRSVEEIPKFGMRTLAYHEAVPGHHYQIALAQEMEGVPFFRRIIPFTAYAEGWALYAEQVAAENGFQDDPYDRLGYLTGQLFRAARLVVDTGIHHKRWTREEAIDYMLAATGMPETDIISEVERYIINPGQACAYMIGKMEILRLRQEAREALGDAFDIREFHRVVLENGALPLTLLRQVVEEWYREQA